MAGRGTHGHRRRPATSHRSRSLRSPTRQPSTRGTRDGFGLLQASSPVLRLEALSCPVRLPVLVRSECGPHLRTPVWVGLPPCSNRHCLAACVGALGWTIRSPPQAAAGAPDDATTRAFLGTPRTRRWFNPLYDLSGAPPCHPQTISPHFATQSGSCKNTPSGSLPSSPNSTVAEFPTSGSAPTVCATTRLSPNSATASL